VKFLSEIFEKFLGRKKIVGFLGEKIWAGKVKENLKKTWGKFGKNRVAGENRWKSAGIS